MSNFKEAQLLYLRANIEALVSEREAMILQNERRFADAKGPAHTPDDFQRNADAIRALAPNPHEFAS